MTAESEAPDDVRPASHFEQDYWRATPKVARPLEPLPADSIPDDQFRLLADNLPTLCWMANGDGYIVWYNRRWHEYCGTTPEEMEGWGWQTVHDPALLPQVMDRWTASVASGEPFEMTFPLRGADGVYRPFLTRIQPVRDATGRVGRWFGVNTEIGATVAAEQALRESEERLRQMFGQAPAFMAMLRGPDHVFELVNPAYGQLIGHRDVVGKSIREALPDLAGQGFFELLDKVYRAGEPYAGTAVEVTLQTRPEAAPDRRVVDFVYQPITDSKGIVSGIFVQGSDVTERTRAEARRSALIELGDRFRDLEDPAEIAYAAAEILGRTLDVSRAGYGTIDRNAETITIERDWNAPGIESLAGVLHFRDYGSYIDDLKRGDTVVFADAEKDPRTAQTADALKAISAQAVVNMPVTEQGGFVALLYLNHATARDWTAEELDFVRDVAERTRNAVARRGAEQALQENEAHLAALFDQAAAGVAETDLEGRLINVNDRYCEIVGRSRDELLAMRLQDITHPEDLRSNLDLFGRLVETGKSFDVEKRYMRPDGSIVWVNNTVSLVRRADGSPGSVMAVCIDISERHSAATALRESEARFREVFENGKLPMVEIDGEWSILGANAAYCELADRGWDELLGLSCLAFTHPDDIARSEAALGEALEGGRVSFEKRYLRRDGQETWIRSNLSRVSAPGAPVRFVKIVEDVTERRAAEQRLLAERRTLETLNRTGAAVAAELDLESVVQLVTDSGVELTGAEFGAFFYNVIADSGESYMLYTLSGAERSQFDFGMPRNTKVFGPTFEGSGVVRSDDITRDARYGQNPPYDGMPKGHLPVRSYLAVPVIGRTGDVIGGLFFGHSEPGRFTERHEQLMTGIAAQAAVAIDNARLYQSIQRANETLEQRVGERTAELETANEALRQAQKMEAIGQLTGGIAHDFNNMLTVIRGSADMLQRRELGQEKRERYVQAIADTADRAARLTSQLLAFARRQTLKPERFDVVARVQSIEDMLRTVLGSRIRLIVEADCPDCFVQTDIVQFETALVNMAVNARDAMDGEGELRIAIRRADQLPAGTAPAQPSAYVAVSVSDTGQGIAPGDLQKIFEPFFTTKEIGKGTGLGLSQVYGFAKQSGGEIEVESEVGNGTRFTLYLPESAGGSPQVQPRAARASNKRAGGTVLVVEDNEEVAHFAGQVMAELGYTPIRADDADDALRYLEQRDDIDVVFTDVVMPGKGGIDLAHEVRARWPDLPIVLTSGYSHVLAGHFEHGFPLLHKPYSVEDLAAALERALKP